jgi:N-acetylglutamate synthase-like GNAT family acetyltransferase
LRDERITVAADLRTWVEAFARGFAERRDVLHNELLARIVASAPGVIALEARVDGAVVASAAMSLRGECAALFSGSTLPEHRNRGWQIAMIRDRVARAREAGARIIYASAAVASISERNFHRCGFKTIYTRTRWDREVECQTNGGAATLRV